MQTAERFRHSTYTVRKKILKVFGGSFDIYGPDGSLVLYASQKAFKLKEDIRLYSGKDRGEELLVIKARNIIDFAAAYDVVDPVTHQHLGGFKRRGWKSLAKDEWVVMDHLDNEIGTMKEDNVWLALVRRLMAFGVINIIPQSYHCEIGGTLACAFKQKLQSASHKNPC